MKTNPPINQIVKDEEWQKIRNSFLGKWNKDPNFCCSKISNWLGNISKTSDKKLAIIANYLTGTGFRTGRIKHHCISKIRGSVFGEIKKRKITKKWTL